MVEHAAIHGRGNEERTLGGARAEGEASQDEQIVGDAVRQFGDGIGCGRRNDEHIRGMTQADMQDVRFSPPQRFIGENWTTGH